MNLASKFCVLLYWQQHCTTLQQRASAKLCSIEKRAPPIFGRAAITLGISPHSSLNQFCISVSVSLQPSRIHKQRLYHHSSYQVLQSYGVALRPFSVTTCQSLNAAAADKAWWPALLTHVARHTPRHWHCLWSYVLYSFWSKLHDLHHAALKNVMTLKGTWKCQRVLSIYLCRIGISLKWLYILMPIVVRINN